MGIFVKLTSEELQKRLQEMIDRVADQLKREAVKTICSYETTCPMSVDILIHIGTDMVPTIEYKKEVYVSPIEPIASSRYIYKEDK